ncbi:hypothetical protein [Mycobacterium sp. OTB74]|jgi:hypothetical protein|uniref:hypothetical protein n=1 Tax=Mycobacterium sp. OTB74 TaxID=1853452 RepID=UPI00247728B8|nr:hypothetical protein [Mycobacterium sp. OTB74]MDH6243269.1 hypothetical protein [Mycobacterium sp. OTB74]
MARGPVLSVVDADDHMYETVESLTSYLPKCYPDVIWSKNAPESLGGDAVEETTDRIHISPFCEDGVMDLIDLLGVDRMLFTRPGSL